MSRRVGLQRIALLVGLSTAALLPAALGTGCSASKAPDVETVWLHADGARASDAQVVAARSRCEHEAEGEVQLQSKRQDYMQWGVRMVECMERDGLRLVQRERGSD